jgi:hypothetical protein
VWVGAQICRQKNDFLDEKLNGMRIEDILVELKISDAGGIWKDKRTAE